MGRPAPWLYLFGVLAWTWSFLGLAARFGAGRFRFAALLLAAVGLLGPLAVSTLLIGLGYRDLTLDRSAAGFLTRALDPRTLAARWYGIVALLVLVLAFGPALIGFTVWRDAGLIQAGPTGFLLVGLVAGAVEEPGWRGYAQEGLQRRMPVIAASLVVGVYWALWHLPLFLIPGTYQAGLGLGTPEFWAFHAAIVLGSPVYAWLYNAAGRVIFAAVLYHGAGNVARELAPDVSDVAEVGVEAGLALLISLAAWSWMSRPRKGGGAARES